MPRSLAPRHPGVPPMPPLPPGFDGSVRPSTESDFADQLEGTKYWLFDLLDSAPTPHARLYATLIEAGYTGIRIERLATHSVWQILATVPLNAPVADRGLLKRQIRTLLRAAHLPVKPDEIITMPAGRRIHVSFV